MTSPYLVSTQRGSLSNTDDPTFTAGHMAVGEFTSGPRGIGTLASAHGLVSSASPSVTHPPPAPVAGTAAVRKPSTSSYLNHTPGSHHSQSGHQGHQHNPDHIENRASSGPRAPSAPYSEASVQRGHGGVAGHPSSAAFGDVRGGSASVPRRHTNTSLSRERSNVALGAGGDSVSALAMLSDIGPAAATYDIASGGEALQLSAEEVEARSKARAVLQQFQQQQHKSAQLQQKLDEANAENARLVRMLHDRKVEAASAVDHAGQSRRAAEDKIDEVRRELELAREESQTVAKACAERTADAASQLRLKEHEVRQLEAEVLAAREQARSAHESLRAAVGDETGAGPVVKLKQTEQQMVDIARKLLESEHRVKDLERQIVDGRAAVNDNATSIEGLRRQLVAAEKRADEAEAKRAQDLDSHMDAINAVKQEAEEDKKVLEHLLAAGGSAATPAADRPSGLNHTPGAGGSSADAVQNRSISASDLKHTIAASGRGVETQVLKVQLDASKEIAVQLAQQLQDAHAESDRLRASLEEERSARAKLTETQREQCRRIEYELQVQQQQHRQAFAEREEAQRQIQLALSSVEGGKKDQQQLRDDIDRQHKAALAAAEKYAVAQAELEKLQTVKEENELLQGRTADLEATVAELEHRLKEEEQLHHQAARLARVRAETTDTLAADRCVPLAAPAYLKENDELRARVLALESETKDALTSLQAVQTRAEEDRSAALMEHDRLTRELVAAKQTITDLQADVSSAGKKAGEWKLAFVTAEKKRQHAQEEAEAAQVEAAHGANTNAKQQEHIALLSSHAARLEREVEELARQLSRVRATKPTTAATGQSDDSVLLDGSRNAAPAGSSVSAQPADVTPATPPRPMSGVDVDGRLSPGARAFSTALQDTLQSLDEHSRASSIAPVGYSAPPGVPQPNPTSSAGGSSSQLHQGQYHGGTRSISNNNGGSNGGTGYPRSYAGRDASQEPNSAAYGRASMGAVEAAVEADSASIPNRAPSPGSSPVPVTDSRRPRSAVGGEGVSAPQQAVPLPSSLLGKINGGQSSLPPLSALSHLTGPVTPPASLVPLPGEEAATGGSPDSGVRTVLADIAKELYSPSP